MKDCNIHTGQKQQRELYAKERTPITLQGVGPKKKNPGDHHDSETTEHPGFHVAESLRYGIPPHRKARQPKVEPYGRSNRKCQPQHMRTLDDGKHPDRFAECGAAWAAFNPLTHFKERHKLHESLLRTCIFLLDRPGCKTKSSVYVMSFRNDIQRPAV